MSPLSFFLAALALLIGCSSRAASQILDAPGGAMGGDGGIERAMSLYRAWEDIYGLKPSNHLPPANISLPPNVPPAPHLEDCAARTAFRQAAEQRGADGEPPAWTRPSNCCGCNPQPPWVRGSDAGNLPLTRVAQRDLWAHQFPASCAGKRLLLLDWPKPPPPDSAADASTGAVGAGGAGSGAVTTGSDLPLLLQWAAAALGLAVRFDRVLVIRGAFPPAKHGHCNGTGGKWKGKEGGGETPRGREAGEGGMRGGGMGDQGGGKGGRKRVDGGGEGRVRPCTPPRFSALLPPPSASPLLPPRLPTFHFPTPSPSAPVSPPRSSPSTPLPPSLPFPTDLSASGALHCYFLPFVSQDCERTALDAAAASSSTMPACLDGLSAGAEGAGEREALLKGQEPVVCMKGGSLEDLRGEGALGRQAIAAAAAAAAEYALFFRWGKAYQQQASVLEVEGVVRNDDATLKAYWWQAQALRFLLRWPSALLCHATNRMRHSAYGLRVATHMLLSRNQQTAIIRNVANPDGTPENINKINGSEEAVALARLNFTSAWTLHTRGWLGEGFAGCVDARGGGLTGRAEEDDAFVKSEKGRGRVVVDRDYEGVGGEVYVMRPIVSVQLALSGDRGGAEGGAGGGVAAGGLVGEERWGLMLSAIMGFVHRLRLAVPDMRYIWLSTLAQSVIEESHHHPDWTFIHSQNPRLQQGQAFAEYEKAVGLPEVTSSRLATLLIASESDYFVGARGSAWHGLLNGLRATNGRGFAGHVTLDIDE
ncbi:unnamed protein product [Closterium sp. NIES-64]|nr:unnamed protein product [Closterium sp. NIES-64]